MVRSEETADASLAATRAWSRFGIAIAAIIRMIETTTSNSISENPSWFRWLRFICESPLVTEVTSGLICFGSLFGEGIARCTLGNATAGPTRLHRNINRLHTEGV